MLRDQQQLGEEWNDLVALQGLETPPKGEFLSL